jgi:hypothetical protein
MKHIYNKISIILAGATLLAFAACTEEVLRDASPVPEGGVQAYIPETNSTSLLFLPDDAATTFTITIGRQNTQGRVEVPLSITEKKGLLALSNNIAVFEDGQALTELEVDFSVMEPGESTVLELAIKNDADRYLYGLSKYSITVLRDYKWVDVGEADFKDLFWTGATVKLPVQQAEGALLFRFKDIYSEIFLALDPTDPDIEKCKGYHLQFYLDTTYTDASETYRSCKADSLPTAIQDLGLGMYGITFLWAAPGKSYANYCEFTNEGNVYRIDGVYLNNGELWNFYTFTFTWTDGFPGIIPNPYKDETIVIDSLKRTMTDAAGYYFGWEEYSHNNTDEYGSRIPVYVDNYIVEMVCNDLYISLDMLIHDNASIPAGVYPINNSDLENSVRPGNYAEVSTYGISSYVELAIQDVILYLVSGTVEVEYDNDDNCTITVDAVTAKGSVIQATWTGDLQITDLTSAGAPGAAVKAGLKVKAKAGVKTGQRPQKLSSIK